jgi:hypothetical protein
LQNEECQSLGSVVKEENMSFAVVYEMADMENSARVFPCNRWGQEKPLPQSSLYLSYRSTGAPIPLCPIDSHVPVVMNV